MMHDPKGAKTRMKPGKGDMRYDTLSKRGLDKGDVIFEIMFQQNDLLTWHQ